MQLVQNAGSAFEPKLRHACDCPSYILYPLDKIAMFSEKDMYSQGLNL